MLSMAYNNYRGRTAGRLMFYLYSMDRNADYWAGIGETTVEAYGINIADVTWEEDTDFAIFKFNDKAKPHFQEAMNNVCKAIKERDTK